MLTQCPPRKFDNSKNIFKNILILIRFNIYIIYACHKCYAILIVIDSR